MNLRLFNNYCDDPTSDGNSYISEDGLILNFNVDLTGSQIIQLNNIIDNYVYNPNYDDLFKFKINQSTEDPSMIDYDIVGLNKKRTIINGELRLVEYYNNYVASSNTYSDLVVVESRDYIKDENGIIKSRNLSSSWLLNNGTTGLTVTSTKYYTHDDVNLNGNFNAIDVVTNFTCGLTTKGLISKNGITGNTLNISSEPSNDDTLTDVLVRASDGTIKYRKSSSIGGDNINGLSGLTVGGSVSATTYYGNGENLTGMTGSFGITVDGSNSVLTSGVKGYIIIPYNATITSWAIVGNNSGDCIVDIWRGSNYSIPTISDSITGTEKPNLNSQQINSSDSITSWVKDIFINDVISFNIVSATNISRINLIITVIKK